MIQSQKNEISEKKILKNSILKIKYWKMENKKK